MQLYAFEEQPASGVVRAGTHFFTPGPGEFRMLPAEPVEVRGQLQLSLPSLIPGGNEFIVTFVRTEPE